MHLSFFVSVCFCPVCVLYSLTKCANLFNNNTSQIFKTIHCKPIVTVMHEAKSNRTTHLLDFNSKMSRIFLIYVLI